MSLLRTKDPAAKVVAAQGGAAAVARTAVDAVDAAGAGTVRGPAAQQPTHGPHLNAQEHHGHTHAERSEHPGHHHLLTVEDLNVGFAMYQQGSRFFGARKRVVPVIRNLSISVHVGEIIAVVGASGSGKTLLADAVMGLTPKNALISGTVWFEGQLQDERSLAALRGRGISLVPQSVDHLDPLMRVGAQVEGVAASREDAARCRQRRQQLFARYGLGEDVARLYPHQLSGGMARRVLLCCALMDDPRLIIADEPTPGMDLDLAVAALDDLRAFANAGGGVLLITHDVELALRVADRVAVFKDGTVVEETAVASFGDPQLLRHPFSRALWYALPEHGMRVAGTAELAGESLLAAGAAVTATAGAASGEQAAVSVASNEGATTTAAAGKGPALGSGAPLSPENQVAVSAGKEGLC